MPLCGVPLILMVVLFSLCVALMGGVLLGVVCVPLLWGVGRIGSFIVWAYSPAPINLLVSLVRALWGILWTLRAFWLFCVFFVFISFCTCITDDYPYTYSCWLSCFNLINTNNQKDTKRIDGSPGCHTPDIAGSLLRPVSSMICGTLPLARKRYISGGRSEEYPVQ